MSDQLTHCDKTLIESLTIEERALKLRDVLTILGFTGGGLDQFLSLGILTAIEAHIYKYNAKTSNGNSGGPLIVDGKVVGIHYIGFDAVCCEK